MKELEVFLGMNKMELFEMLGLKGCLDDPNITNQNYREHLFTNENEEDDA